MHTKDTTNYLHNLKIQNLRQKQQLNTIYAVLITTEKWTTLRQQ